MKINGSFGTMAKRIVDSSLRMGTIQSIDFNLLSISLNGCATVLRNVEVSGDARMVKPGDKVSVIFVNGRPRAIV
jgi:hypothetical protein